MLESSLHNELPSSPSKQELQDSRGSQAEKETTNPREQLNAIRDMSRSASAGSVKQIVWLNPGWIAFLASILLTVLGIYVINLTGGIKEGLNVYAGRQMVFFAASLIVCILVILPHYRYLRIMLIPLVVFVILLLVMVLLPLPRTLIPVRNGATRWINLGFADFQPSELAKVVFVLAIAGLLQRRISHRTFTGMLLLFAYTAIPVGLIIVEPDLGTASLFVPVLMSMLVAGGSKIRHLLFVAVMGGMFVAFVVSASLYFASGPEPSYPLLREHQVRRIQAMVNTISGDKSGAETINYQGDKARTVAGAGGITGLDEHTARATVYFNALPEDHNDMIYAVICNRFGFLGGVIVIFLYVLISLSALWVAAKCREPFGRIIAVGYATMIAVQAAVNIGMTIGLLPITGMTLPFVSYGGSSLITAFIMIGLMLNIALRPPGYLQKESFEFESAGKNYIE